MKLHLPKQLFTALLAAITLAAPAAWGLEITGSGDLEVITLKASQSYDGANFDYTVADGIGTTTSLTQKENDATNDDVEITFTLNNNAFKNVTYDNGKDSAKIVWVKSTSGENKIWGFAAYNANTDDGACEVTGMWEGNEWKPNGTNWTTGSATASSNTYIDVSDTAATTTYTATIGENGTILKDAASTAVYNQGGLKTSTTAIRLESVYINSAFVSTFQAKEYSTLTFSNGGNGNWSKSYTRTELNNAVSSVMEVGLAGVANAYDIVAGGSGGLVITAAADEQVTVSNTLYLASAATNGDAVVSITNNGAVNLNGPVYLVENSKISTSSGDGIVTFGGKVTDKGVPTGSENATVDGAYTLSLSGTGYNFAGGLDVTGLSLEANANLTLGGGTAEAPVAHRIGTLTGDGSVTLASNATLTMYMASNSAQNTPNLGSLALNDNTTLNIDIGNKTFYRIGTATVSGSATIASQNSNGGWEFSIDIDLLTNDKTDSTEDTLSIVSNTNTANRSIVNIVGGDFDGTINLTGSGTSGSRKLALNVKNASVLADTVVQMHGMGSQVALAVGVDSITLKGIADQANASGTMKIVSGAQQYGSGGDFTSDTTFRMLVIDTDGTTDNAAAVDSSTSATLGSYLNLQKQGAGSQSFSGNLSAFNGSIEVTGGSLTLGAEGQSGTMGLDGTINVSSEAALYLYNSFTNVDLTKLDTEAGVTYSDGVNGYASATYILVKNEGTITVGSGVSVNEEFAIEARSAGTGNVTFTVESSSGDYYVNTDVVYNTGSSSNIVSAATTGIILNGGTLDMQTSLNADDDKPIGITAYKNATIKLNGDNVTLQQGQLTVGTGGAVTLTGSGVYDLGALGNGVKHSSMTAENDATRLSSDDWTGTVSFSGGTKDIGNNTKSVQDINFNLLGLAGSSVEIAEDGVYGYLLSGNTTFDPNIMLSGDLILQNGYGGSTYTFNGDFSGSGNFETYKALSNNSVRGLDFVFAGDMSQWTGELVQNMQDNKYSYKFAAAEGIKNTTIANGIVAKSTATMDVIVSNNKEVTMAGTLTAETGSTLKVTHEGAGNLNVKSVEVQGNGEVQVAGLHITATDSAANATMTAKADTTGALKYLAAETSFTIQDMTLTNTTITAATPTTQVKLQNVTATSDVVLAKGAFTMGETAQVAVGGDGTTGNDFTTSLLSGITLQNAVVEGVRSSTLVVDLGDLSCVSAMGPGKYNLSITLSDFTMGDYTQGLLFAADSWLGKLLSAQGATAYVSGAVETPASVSEGGGVSVSYSSTGTGDNVGTIITIRGLNVPEPTTATLSLLALAALAARRRRND